MDYYPLPSLSQRPCLPDMVLAELLAQGGFITDEQIVWAVGRAAKIGHTLGRVLKEMLCLSALQLFSLRRLAVKYLADSEAPDSYLARVQTLLSRKAMEQRKESAQNFVRLAA